MRRFSKLKAPSKGDKTFVALLKKVRSGLRRRMGTEMCKELHASCRDCKTRFLIGLINDWIDLLN